MQRPCRTPILWKSALFSLEFCVQIPRGSARNELHVYNSTSTMRMRSPQHKLKACIWQLHLNHLFGQFGTKWTAYKWQTHLCQMMNHFWETSCIFYNSVPTWLAHVAQVFTSQTGCIYRLNGRTSLSDYLLCHVQGILLTCELGLEPGPF